MHMPRLHRYHADSFPGYGWFIPSSKFKLKLTFTTYKRGPDTASAATAGAEPEEETVWPPASMKVWDEGVWVRVRGLGLG